MTEAERASYNAIQSIRQKAGVGSLTPSDPLLTAARRQLDWIVTSGGYEYLNPANGPQVSPHTGTEERVRATGYQVGFASPLHMLASDASQCEQLLMMSEVHASGVLEPGREIGISITADPKLRAYHCYAYVAAAPGVPPQAPAVAATWPVDGATDVPRAGLLSTETRSALGIPPSQWYAGFPIVIKPGVTGIPRERHGVIVLRAAVVTETDTGAVVPTKVIVRSATPEQVTAAAGISIAATVNRLDNAIAVIPTAPLKRLTRYTASVTFDVDGKPQSRQIRFSSDGEYLAGPNGMPM